jgi:hypothetical protein
MPRQPTSPFTLQERDLIRLELMPRFGQEPDLANGLFLRTWRGGPQKGQPKIPKAIQSMLDRGLVRIGTNQWVGHIQRLAGCSAECVPALL